MKNCYFLIFSTFIFFLPFDNCVYRAPSLEDVIFNVPILSEDHENYRIRRSINENNFPKLRIYAHFDVSFLSLPNAEELKTKVITPAIEYWQDILSLRIPSKHLLLNRKCNSKEVFYYQQNSSFVYYCAKGCAPLTYCGLIPIPQEHLQACRTHENGRREMTDKTGNGVENHDFILYISIINDFHCQNSTNTLAFAAHCQLESTLDRPIAGYMNFCPNRLSTDFGRLEQAQYTAKHEILHALGFAYSLYAFYRTPNGEPLTERDNRSGRPKLGLFASGIYKWSDHFAQNITRPWRSHAGIFNKSSFFITTPNVMREAQSHFNCSSLLGMELEDQGGLGMAHTHWEKRLLENDLMSPTFTHTSVTSRITLALMHDTGWYVPDYSKADSMKWGRGAGCDFVNLSCYEYMQSNRIEPYCNQLSDLKNNDVKLACSADGIAYGYCNLVLQNEALPPQYQYFAQNSRYAGDVALADYCPFIQEFNWQLSSGQTQHTSHCKEAKNNRDHSINYSAEYYGPNSHCFSHADKWTGKQCDGKSWNLVTYGAGCYRYNCSPIFGLLIYLNNDEYQCLTTGQQINISSHNGYFLTQGALVCPACEEICSNCPNPILPKPTTRTPSQEVTNENKLSCENKYVENYNNSKRQKLSICLFYFLLFMHFIF